MMDRLDQLAQQELKVKKVQQVILDHKVVVETKVKKVR